MICVFMKENNFTKLMLSHIGDEDKSSIIIGDNSLALIVIALPSSFVKHFRTENFRLEEVKFS